VNPPQHGEGDHPQDGGGASPRPATPRNTIKRARKLRSEMSLPEVQLWRKLHTRPGEYKFRRQHGIGDYVLDFYCAAAKLAIEVDGRAHDNARRVERDQLRSEFLRSYGIATTRIPAQNVLQDMEAVVLRIVQICEERVVKLALGKPLHHPLDGPPPRFGEDFS
jgi:very-short-patch-repair endonuclease